MDVVARHEESFESATSVITLVPPVPTPNKARRSAPHGIWG